ncbi:MAG: PadR family transcriptional regulator [Bacteroidetes bacterium]|nr:PadR family transcriptional regulator [Bacteroidota bacterium]MCL5026097.1 PadR family transcriptional regulator [Chloroflexota bacterium]
MSDIIEPLEAEPGGATAASAADNCVCPTGKVERFVQACVLLFLARGPSHGYDLFHELVAFDLGQELPDLATLYKNLRRMEARGLVTSQWQAGAAGPGRRGYRLTPKGQQYLERWVQALAHGRSLIDRFLAEKGRLASLHDAQRLPATGPEAGEREG